MLQAHGSKIGEDIRNLSKIAKWTKFKKPDFVKTSSIFFFSGLKKISFIKILIFKHFDQKCHICMKIDSLAYVIGWIFSQRTSNQQFSYYMTYKVNDQANLVNLLSQICQLYLVAFFFKKIFFAKTWYITHNQEFLAIIEIFKTWYYYLKGKLFDYNNYRQFMNIKSLSFCYIYWAPKLSQYYFQILLSKKANVIADALSCFS